MLTIQSMKVNFGKFTALDIQEPLRFEKGDRIGVIGSNGAGKTTMIRALLGLVPYQGSVQSQVQPHQMAVHMQKNNYYNTVSSQTIIEGLLNTRIKDNSRLQELIEFFEFGPNLKKKFNHLSGGQQNRLTLIMVMYQDSPLTFLDEVTSGLDFETRQKLMEKLNTYYQDKDATLLLVSHYYEELEQMANRILLLDKGKVICFGKVDELFHQYCGQSVIKLAATEENKQLVEPFKQIHAPLGHLALRVDSTEEEIQILERLSKAHVDFSRSSKDIELISINAKRSLS